MGERGPVRGWCVQEVEAISLSPASSESRGHSCHGCPLQPWWFGCCDIMTLTAVAARSPLLQNKLSLCFYPQLGVRSLAWGGMWEESGSYL